MPPTSPMGVISESAAAQLLDFSQRLDIGLLDRVVNCMYHEAGAQQKVAEKVLNTLKEHPDAWMRVDSILEFSSNQETKYFALQILEALIKTRWKVLARPQCEGIKKYIVGLIIQTSSNSELLESEKTYLGKLNMIWLRNSWGTPIAEGRSKQYAPILSKLRRIMISRMARPEEVLVVENEHGEVVREFMKDTDSLNLYKSMRETLVYLTHLDHSDTKKIMIEKLQHQVDGREWSWHNLNTLCWAIGSISGAMQEDDERSFLVVVIRDLLGLCEQKRGKDNKAIVASNIMYVVGQYPRFLRAHWRFLKTVITKLFEFMHETHEGVQDMACDTFIKIAQKCRRQLVTIQYGEAVEFIEEILKEIDIIINDLQPQQVHTFYEAVGVIISAQTDSAIQARQIERLFRLPNQIWDGILVQAASNIDLLRDFEVVKQLCNLLKTNHSACKSLGHSYLVQLGRIYLDMLNIYKIMSQNIGQAVAANGEQVTKQPLIRSMRSVKKALLNLLSCWIQRSTDPVFVAENIVPPLLDAVADDYQKNLPAAREAEVLNLMATLVNRLEDHILPALPRVLDAVFQSTLEMIDKDLEEFPEHRTNFFTLLQAVNAHCFSALLSLTPDKFKLILDSVIWAIKHTMRQVSETGLNILHTMLVNMSSANSEQRQVFFKTFFMDILQHMFAVITDRSQTGNLTLQSSLLAYMFKIVENDIITVLLATPQKQHLHQVQRSMYNMCIKV
ncbi:unnamed protein product [Heterobilharzia americana]|nr:unnamed protein product [Heterobilharzia americana]